MTTAANRAWTPSPAGAQRCGARRRAVGRAPGAQLRRLSAPSLGLPPRAPSGSGVGAGRTPPSWERRGQGPESERVRAGSPGRPRTASGSWPGCQAAPPDLWVVRAPCDSRWTGQ